MLQLQEEGLAVTKDNNEECCGACRLGGDLICCEGCPAAFHPECAGYCSADEVPEGDWLCWFCAKDTHKRYQHPKAQFKQQAGHAHVLLGTDDSAEVFVRVKLLNTSDKNVECSCLDVKAKPEVVPKTSHRLWHGTLNKAAWTVDPDGIHWRPNCRVYKVDKAALAALQSKGPQQQQQPAAVTPSSNTSPDTAATNGVPKGRSKLKLHFRGVKGTARSPRTQDQQQERQQTQAGSLLGGPLPKGQTPRVKLSAPPSPSPPVADSAALPSPDGTAPGPTAFRGQDGEDAAAAAAAAADNDGGGGDSGGGAGTAAAAAAAEAGAGQDLSRVSDGEVAPRLPPIQGGADKQSFDAALQRFWSERVRAPGERLPSTSIILGGVLVEPWAFWREVWAWGGPDEVVKRKLWATVAHTFSPGAGSISTRASVYYATALAPFDKAIDAGHVTLERPAHTRQPSDRWQKRSRSPSVGLKRPPSLPNLLPTATSSQLSGDEGTAAAAAAAAAPAGGAAGSRGRQRQRQGQGQRGARRQRPQQQAQRAKRRRVDQWSDNDEGDVILAGDVESTDESEDGRLLGSSSDEGVGQQQDLWQRRRHQHRGLAAANGRPGSTGSPKRLRVSVGKVKEDLVAGGLDSAGGYEYLRQPTDLVVLGKVTLAPAAQDIQVGDCVDFRQACSSGRCVTGWRSGVVLAVAPGSEWEGGRRLLIQPQHTTHHHHHHSHQLQGSTPSLTPDSPAAAALAAVAAAGGPTGGSAAELAVHKLLTPGGHLRHELAGLLPARSGSIKPASAGDTVGTPPPPAAAAGCSSQRQQQQENGPDAADEPQWTPMVWRGPWSQPFLAPPVVVRPHYTPTTHVVVPGGGASGAPAAAAAAEDSIQSPFASPQQQQQQCGQGPGGQQQQQQELRVGAYVEVLRDGCWCPAQVLELLPGGAAGAAGVCVVLRSMAPPEADGSVWRCSGTHPMRPMHPRYTSGCGMVQCAGPEELVTVAAMRKAMAPYVYTENVHAFACMDHMRASAAAAQG